MKKLLTATLLTALLTATTANAGIAGFISDILYGSRDCINEPDSKGVYHCNNKKTVDYNFYAYKDGSWYGCPEYPFDRKKLFRERNTVKCYVMLGGMS